MKKKQTIAIACFMALIMSIATIYVPVNSCYAATTNEHIFNRESLSEIILEQVVNGVNVLFPTTPRNANAIINQELVHMSEVPVLITTYALDGFEYEVFQLMQYSEFGTLTVLPTDQAIISSSFINEFNEFSNLRSDNNQISSSIQESQSGLEELEFEATSNPNHVSGWNFSWDEAEIPRTNASYRLWTSFNWEMRDNTNFGNPLWDWQRVKITNLVVDVLPSLGINNVQNLNRITIELIAKTYGTVGISYSLSWPSSASVSLSPPNNSSSIIIREDFIHALGVGIRLDRRYWDINLDRNIAYPLNVWPGNGNWVSLEVIASFMVGGTYHMGYLGTGVTFRRSFFGLTIGNLGVDRYSPITRR